MQDLSVLQSFARWGQSCFVGIKNGDTPLVCMLKDEWNKELGRKNPSLSCYFVFNSKYKDFFICAELLPCVGM